MTRTLTSIFAWALVLGLARTAAAQSVLVVPPLTAEGVDREQTATFVKDWLASHDRRVVTAEAALARSLEPCITLFDSTPPSCAFDYHQRSGADQVLVVWLEADRAIVATIIERGLYYSGNARASTWQLALAQALADARRRETRGLGPWLELTGFPGEAKVVIDGSPAGRLRGPPIRLSQGAHQVEVRAEGYRSKYELISLPTATSHASRQIDLETESPSLARAKQSTPSGAANDPSTEARRRVRWSRARLGGGIVALALGTLLVARGAMLVNQRNSCDEDCGEGSTEHAGRVPLALGTTLAIGGLGLISWDIYMRLNANRDVAVLNVGGRF